MGDESGSAMDRFCGSTYWVITSDEQLQQYLL